MFTTEQLLGYLAVAAVLVVVPGPNTALILAQSLAGGRRAGLATVAGVELGTLVHIAAGALGVSAVVARSALAFDLVKLVGAGVLIFLGARELLGQDGGQRAAGAAAPRRPSPRRLSPRRLSPRRALARAFVGNVLNPKVAVFFLAFLPQWVDPGRGSVAVQFVVLGALLSLLGLASGALLALAAVGLAERLGGSSGFWRWQRRLTGGVLIALGLRLVWAEAG